MQPRDVDVVNDSMLYILDSENMRVQRVMLGSNELASVIGGDSAVSVSELMSSKCDLDVLNVFGVSSAGCTSVGYEC